MKAGPATAAVEGAVPGGADDAVVGGADPGRERGVEDPPPLGVVAPALAPAGAGDVATGSCASGAVPLLPWRLACSSWSW